MSSENHLVLIRLVSVINADFDEDCYRVFDSNYDGVFELSIKHKKNASS